MSTTTALMTYAEFERMPDDGKRYELRHGEMFEMPPARHRHRLLQMRAYDLLVAALAGRGFTAVEFAFRPQSDLELWSADVGFATKNRESTVDLDDNLRGSPDLVVEVLSSSNTVEEMNDREQTCFGGGTLEFWLVQPKTRTVRVSRSNGTFRNYSAGQQIPLDSFGGGSIPVADIFAPLDDRA